MEKEMTDEERRAARVRKFAGKGTDTGKIAGTIGYNPFSWSEHTIGKNKGSGKKRYRTFAG
jgi:hypothetical protein